MQRNNKSSDQIFKAQQLKTVSLFAGTNIFAGCVKRVSSSAGLLAMITLNAALIYHLNESGRNKRIADNTHNKVFTLFRPGSSARNVENTYRNIAAGGNDLFDWIAKETSELRRNNSSRS